jgi:Ankyrin repeats (3 copies)
MSTKFLELPGELHLDILSYIDKQQDLRTLILVCKQCYTRFYPSLLRFNIQHRQSRALLWAAQDSQNHIRLAHDLLRAGANANVKGCSVPQCRMWHHPRERERGVCEHILGSRTALHFAAMGYGASTELVNLLLEYGADPLATDDRGNTAMMGAFDKLWLRQGDYTYDILRALTTASLKAANLSTLDALIIDTRYKRNPLHVAVAEHYFECVEYLCDGWNVDVNVKDGRGDTALHLALKARRPMGWPDLQHQPFYPATLKTIQLLMWYGASWTILSSEGQSADRLASSHPNFQVRAMFDCSLVDLEGDVVSKYCEGKVEHATRPDVLKYPRFESLRRLFCCRSCRKRRRRGGQAEDTASGPTVGMS